MFVALAEEHPEGFQCSNYCGYSIVTTAPSVILSSVNYFMYLEGLTLSYEYNSKRHYP